MSVKGQLGTREDRSGCLTHELNPIDAGYKDVLVVDLKRVTTVLIVVVVRRRLQLTAIPKDANCREVLAVAKCMSWTITNLSKLSELDGEDTRHDCAGSYGFI